MLEKLKKSDWYIQLVVLLAVAGVLFFCVWYFVTGDVRDETARINEEVAQLRSKNEAARVATQRINEFRALYASKSEEYEELKVLLPEQREITNVLQGLQDTANGSKMIMMRFSPRDDTSQDSIMAKPVEVEVDANFNNLRAFFDSVAKLPRIVSVTDFKINQLDKQSGQRTIHAQFLLTAYYATPSDMVPTPAAVPGQPPVPGQPAPVTPPAAAPAN